MNSPSRRRFLKTGASASALAFPFVSTRNVLGANSRLNVAGIGVGGKGAVDIGYCGELGENVVALCDVDQNRAASTYGKFPKAKRYVDFRKMFDEMSGEIDAVTISTPDHTHVHPAIRAMKEGKHVYVQKPLTHTVEEARLLTRLAEETGVVTQMGNQGHSEPNSRRVVELIRHNVLGKVTDIHVWTDRPIWPQGMQMPKGSLKVPSHLDWDLWLGPAPERPYNTGYAPFKWRGWWDFGTGSIGDMACHNMDMIFWALNLRDPISVEAQTKTHSPDSPPKSCEIKWVFPGLQRGETINLTWYDGGRKPNPSLIGRSQIKWSNGAIIIGTDDRMYVPWTWGKGYFVSSDTMSNYDKFVPQSLPRVPGAENDQNDRAHHYEWLEACKGNGRALSHFGYSGPMTEAVLLGNVALRSQKKIEWDTQAMEVTNVPEANQFVRKQYRKGWELVG